MAERTSASVAAPAGTHDFGFLDGSFDVVSRRLRDPLDPLSGWVQTRATARAQTLFDGAISIDEMWFPDGGYYGMSLRVHNPTQRHWTVYWLDSRTGRLQSPVRGSWDGSRCWLTGPDQYRGRPIEASYSWFDVTPTSASWEQCFSTDHGASWQPNWTMDWVRRDTEPDHVGGRRRLTADFDFLAGTWTVHHRRRLDPFDDAAEEVGFVAAQRGWTFFNGAVSVDELELAEPGHRGLTFRTYDPTARQWSIYWVNSRVGELEPPVIGRFAGAVGTFHSVEVIDGRETHVRFLWDGISATTARWRQAFSVDAGSTWSDNWEMRLQRAHAT